MNISTIDSAYINVDWTPPASVSFVKDGNIMGIDIDTVSSFDQYSSYWGISSDQHSGILSYEYSMGSSPGDIDLVGWNTTPDTFSLDSGQAVSNAQNIYYNVRAINNAGLSSSVISSNGQMVFWPAATASYTIDTNQMCFGDSIALMIQSQYYDSLVWMMGNATALSYNDSIQWVQFDSSGIYPIYQMAFGPGGNNATTINNNISVHPLPFASFSIRDSLLSLGDPIAVFLNNSSGGYAFYWDFGDGYNSIDNQPWHEYSTPGVYDVTLIVQSEYCGNDTLIKNSFVHINTNIDNVDSSSISFYENVISFNNLNNLYKYSISLYDIQSKLIKKWDKISLSRINLNQHLKEKSIYFVTVSKNQQRIINKLILKN